MSAAPVQSTYLLQALAPGRRAVLALIPAYVEKASRPLALWADTG